jgi:hypothetical protein
MRGSFTSEVLETRRDRDALLRLRTALNELEALSQAISNAEHDTATHWYECNDFLPRLFAFRGGCMLLLGWHTSIEGAKQLVYVLAHGFAGKTYQRPERCRIDRRISFGQWRQALGSLSVSIRGIDAWGCHNPSATPSCPVALKYSSTAARRRTFMSVV